MEIPIVEMHVMIYSIDFAVNMATTIWTIVTEEPAVDLSFSASFLPIKSNSI
jgi:hypothetical protein